MGIFNRRYALIGWLVWQLGRRIAAAKAKQAVPTVDRKTKRPNKSAFLGAIAGLAITAWIVGKLKRGGGSGHVGE
jgi:hypothetical protein